MTESWTEAKLAELPVKGGVRQRGVDMTRLETFCDAAFAFAVTLLVVGDGIPRSYAELIQSLLGAPAFAASFASIAYFWWAHRTWSRRYGLEDGLTSLISLAMVFVMLIYVYPLKMVFTAFASFASGGYLPTEFTLQSSSEMVGIFAIYGLGFAALNGLMGLLHLRVLRAEQDLRLDALEKMRTRQSSTQFLVLALTGLASMIWAVALPPSVAMFAGFWYMTLPVSMPVLAIRQERKIRKMEAG